MTLIANDDALLRRRVTALHVGLVLTVLILIVGLKVVDLPVSPAPQLAVLVLGVVVALVVERRLERKGTRRCHRPGG